jgi:Flp pilus assembly protein TadG
MFRAALQILRPLRRFGGDRRGASAIEFALVSAPFLFMIVGVMQLGLVYVTSASLNGALAREIDRLIAANMTPPPSNGTVKSNICNTSSIVSCSANVEVEVDTLTALVPNPIANGASTSAPAFVDVRAAQSNAGGAQTVLVIRARAAVPSFLPMFGSNLVVYAGGVVRRAT